MFPSRYMPCPHCGASLERWLEFQLFQLRDEVDEFEAELAEYLASPPGRFELYYAERGRARRRG